MTEQVFDKDRNWMLNFLCSTYKLAMYKLPFRSSRSQAEQLIQLRKMVFPLFPQVLKVCQGPITCCLHLLLYIAGKLWLQIPPTTKAQLKWWLILHDRHVTHSTYTKQWYESTTGVYIMIAWLHHYVYIGASESVAINPDDASFNSYTITVL